MYFYQVLNTGQCTFLWRKKSSVTSVSTTFFGLLLFFYSPFVHSLSASCLLSIWLWEARSIKCNASYLKCFCFLPFPTFNDYRVTYLKWAEQLLRFHIHIKRGSLNAAKLLVLWQLFVVGMLEDSFKVLSPVYKCFPKFPCPLS
ncbi:hypothetical protein XELAEV_18033644mg [Xenopus laevis]|uniref:Uncharacterized protein n=1 Tax=Xenopus laevis TaxID=8355 RepID=A0A974HE61_XENLA|nr:hypothetical protein XELAEV_18033644mg [Xenopus laevis]